MGKGFRPRRPKAIGVRKQRAFLRARWPEFDCNIVGGNKLVCEGWLKPDSSCRRYRVRIVLQAGHHPRVYVLDPPLQRRSGAEDEKIPHVYAEGSDPRPCLYYRYEWDGSMRVADTIVPWLLEWLLFYEIWHATGEWYGGGVDHEPSAKETT